MKRFDFDINVNDDKVLTAESFLRSWWYAKLKKKSPTFYGTWNYYRILNNNHWFLSLARSIQTIPNTISLRSIYILCIMLPPYAFVFRVVSLQVSLPNQNSVRISHLPHARYIPFWYYSPCFGHLNTWQRIQVMEILNVQIPLPPDIELEQQLLIFQRVFWREAWPTSSYSSHVTLWLVK